LSLSVALPFVSLALLTVILARHGGDWRRAALEAAVVWGAFLALATEGLSLLGLLTRGWLAGLWAAGALALGAWLLRMRHGVAPAERPLPHPEALPHPEERLPTEPRLLLTGVAALLALVAFTALVAPPNNWDSMNYHLPRVVQWIQRHSVRHFPTNYLPQLEHPPLAEFVILHLQLLYGGDRFANLVQWLALAGSATGVSLVARQLGAAPRGQVIATVVAVTLPMAILQGSSTQNDLAVSFWLVAFAFFALRAMAAERPGVGDAAWVGASLGLALLTKGTAYLFAAPFCVWVAAALVRKLRWSVWRPGLVITGLMLLLNGGHYLRNTALFGRPISDGGEAGNHLRTPVAIASIVVKNLSVHLGTPFVPVNALIDGAIRALHQRLGLDVNDPRTTCWGEYRFRALNTHEDSAGNPLHLLLVLAAAPALAWRRKLRGWVAGHGLAVGAAAFLFCLMLKYQPLNSRLHTPLFLLMAPVVAHALQSTGASVSRAVAATLLLAAAPWVLFNGTRPIVSITTARSGHRASILEVDRFEQYFANPQARHLVEPYRQAAEMLGRDGGDLGLLLPPGAFEYPLWVLLKPEGAARRLGHVAVRNVSRGAALPGERFEPAAILRVRERYFTHAPPEPWEGATEGLDSLRIGEGGYVRRGVFGPVDVFLRVPAISRLERPGGGGPSEAR
jgi:hypothetical protein